MAITTESLNSKFEIPGALKFEAGRGGLIKAKITTPAAEGEIYLHGAHVTHYQPKGQKPLFFMSGKSDFEAGKPIRGGIPICFPWFGGRQSPAHGFARLREWTVESTGRADDGSVKITLSLSSDAQTKSAWPADFVAKFTAVFGSTFHMSLEVKNTGSAPCSYEEALHTYFAIADVRQAMVQGLEGTTFMIRVPTVRTEPQGPNPIKFTGETDRIYLDTRATCVIHDVTGGRNISVAKEGSTTTVVWNPWIDKAKAMPDFGDEEWPDMVCVETCNVIDAAINLQPGQTHTCSATIHGEVRS